MPLIVGIVIIIAILSLFGGSKSDDSFFRRRTFWERLTGEEPTFIEKVEEFVVGVICFAVLAFVIYHIFDILELLLDILDLDVFDSLPRRRR